MKNWYGVIHNPNKYHDSNCDPYVADVVRHPFIAGKLRLTVLDGVERAVPAAAPPSVAGGLFPLGLVAASADPVAADLWAWQVIDAERARRRLPTLAADGRAPAFIATAARLRPRRRRPGAAERWWQDEPSTGGGSRCWRPAARSAAAAPPRWLGGGRHAAGRRARRRATSCRRARRPGTRSSTAAGSSASSARRAARSPTSSAAPAGCGRTAAAPTTPWSTRWPAASTPTRSRRSPSSTCCPASWRSRYATAGCNVECKFCQNWEISQFRPEQVQSVLAAAGVAGCELAKRSGTKLTAATYSEPVVFWEYVRDVAMAARAAGLRPTVVSNGFIQEQPLREVLPLLDAVKVDLKAFTEAFYREQVRGKLEPVLKTLEIIRGVGRLARDRRAAGADAQRLRGGGPPARRAGSRSTSGPTCRCTSPASTRPTA